MTIQVREFVDHQKETRNFVVEAVAHISQRLNEQCGRRVRCHYSNGELQETLYL